MGLATTGGRLGPATTKMRCTGCQRARDEEERVRKERRRTDHVDLVSDESSSSPSSQPRSENGTLHRKRLERDGTVESCKDDVGREGFSMVEEGEGVKRRAGRELLNVVAWEGEDGRE